MCFLTLGLCAAFRPHILRLGKPPCPLFLPPLLVLFEALARQKLPGWQPATSCLDPRIGHSCPLVHTRTAEVYSIHPGNASIFLRKNKLFLLYFCPLVCKVLLCTQHVVRAGYKKKKGCVCSPSFIVVYSMTLDTTPEATVRPPSRIANRRPSSMAMGVISLIVIVTWSPGMTISTPSGSWMDPVTSVVRK